MVNGSEHLRGINLYFFTLKFSENIHWFRLYELYRATFLLVRGRFKPNIKSEYSTCTE